MPACLDAVNGPSVEMALVNDRPLTSLLVPAHAPVGSKSGSRSRDPDCVTAVCCVDLWYSRGLLFSFEGSCDGKPLPPPFHMFLPANPVPLPREDVKLGAAPVLLASGKVAFGRDVKERDCMRGQYE